MIRKLEDCEAGMLFTSMIIDRVGRHEVLLPITHNQYNFKKKFIKDKCLHRRQYLKLKIPTFGNLPVFLRIIGCCHGYCDQFCDWLI